MSHVSGDAVKALLAITEVQASDDAIISLDFEGIGPSVHVTDEEGNPIRLWQLREIANAFKMWI